ncbi:MAG: ATP-binding protein, partial [Planctomycetota bacterium]
MTPTHPSRTPASDPGGDPRLAEAARARQVARALSQLTDVVWIQLDSGGKVLAWSVSAAAIVDPLARLASAESGIDLRIEDCLHGDESREAVLEALERADHAPQELEVDLGGPTSCVRLRLVARRTPPEIHGDSTRPAGWVLAGAVGHDDSLGLALLDADLVTVVDAWPGAERVLELDRRGRALPFPSEQRVSLRSAMLRGRAARARASWGVRDGDTRWLQLELVALRGSGQTPDRTLAVIEEVADARRATLELAERERRLRRVVEATSSVTGRGFLRSLVKSLSRALDVRVAYVAERLPAAPDRLRMLCLWSGRDFTSGYEYPLEGTLDGDVLTSGPQRREGRLPAQPGLQAVFGLEGLDRFYGIPIPDSDGAATGVLGVVSDGPLDQELPVEEILGVFAARVGVELERLRAEERLRASEDRWRTVLENAPDLILSVDRLGRVLFHNQPRLEGLPRPGQLLIDTVDRRDRDALRRVLDVVLEGGLPGSGEFRATFGLGEPRWYSARIGPLRRTELVTAVIVVATDITERKQRDAQRERRSTIEQQVTTISTALLILPAGRLHAEIGRALSTLAESFGADSAAIYQTFGSDRVATASHAWSRPGRKALPRELTGESLAWLGERVLTDGQLVITEEDWIGSPERRELLRLEIERVIGVRFELHGGQQGVLLLASEAVPQRQGLDPELVALIHIAGDLFANAFEREQSERQRAELEQELQHSQRLEAIGNLAGGIAHDFNNLLTGIMGHASLLTEQGVVDERAAKAARVIETAAERASAMTSQLLGFARRREAQFESIDLHATIDETVTLLERVLPPQVELVLDLAPGKGLVWGEAGLLSQVLLNLAVNAGDALPDGGRLEFRTERADLRREHTATLPELSAGPYLVLEVTDDGSGMSDGVLDRIFEPFFTTKEAGRGTGMGLSVVYGIVRKHGGAIRCRSAVGIGTSFRIWLPMADAEAEAEVELADEPLVEIPIA